MSVGRVVAPGFPDEEVRRRAREGAAAVFPFGAERGLAYGAAVVGQGPRDPGDAIDRLRIVPPVLSEERLRKLEELGREPYYADVDLTTDLGGFTAPMPLYVSALGSTKVIHGDWAVALSRQAGRLALPMVIGENVATVHGYARRARAEAPTFKERALAYLDALPEGYGGLVVQQSTEDADAELWNRVYSDPDFGPAIDSGRLGFELKLGQGAKPGLGGLTFVDDHDAAKLGGHYRVEAGTVGGLHLRASAPGTFTPEILRSQVRLMRNNYPRAKTWVKLPPGRDVADAARLSWEAGADAAIVDGAEGGSGLAPSVFLQDVGLPLSECLRRIGSAPGCLLASGRMWEGGRILKTLALGARASGIGRAAVIAVREDAEKGLGRLVEAAAFELRLLVSALGKYRVTSVRLEDVWGELGSPEKVDPG